MSLGHSLLDQPQVVSGHWKTVLAIVLIFAFGCFSGALSTSLITQHEEGRAILTGRTELPQLLQRRLLRDILLESDQKQKVDDLFAANFRQRKEIDLEDHPRIQALDAATTQQIDAVLTSDQREQFHHNLEWFKDRYGATVFDPQPAPAQP